jgi:hypothetical protein
MHGYILSLVGATGDQQHQPLKRQPPFHFDPERSFTSLPLQHPEILLPLQQITSLAPSLTVQRGQRRAGRPYLTAHRLLTSAIEMQECARTLCLCFFKMFVTYGPVGPLRPATQPGSAF